MKKRTLYNLRPTLADKHEDGTLWTVEDMLKDTLKDIREKNYPVTKAVLILLDDSDDKYAVGFSQAGLSCSGMIALCDVLKAILLAEMGY